MTAATDADQPVRFGSFELDIRSRELHNGATRIRLQDQPFEILRMMLERDLGVINLAVDPRLESIRSDTRVVSLIERLGL